MQEFEIEFEPTAKEFEIDISNKVREVTPSLIDLEVTPSKEEQIFTHEGEFGYDKVKVNSTPLQEKEIVPSKEVIEVVPDEDYLALEKVTVNSIPEEYTIPEGTIEIIRNGVYDVKDYVNADVRTSGIDPDEYFKRVHDVYRETWKNLVKKLPRITVNIDDCANLFYDSLFSEMDGIDFTKPIKNAEGMFHNAKIKKIIIPDMEFDDNASALSIFQNTHYVNVLDISGLDFSKLTKTNKTEFQDCGYNSTVADGAYANRIPYVYVKDAKTRNLLLNNKAMYGVPSTWSKENVICPQSQLSQLIIKGADINTFKEAPYFVQLEVSYNEYDDAYDDQRGVVWSVISGNASVDENGLVTIQTANTGDEFVIQATSVYDNTIVSTYTITAFYLEPKYSINLNDGEWVDSGTTKDGSIVYKSDKGSYHINNGKSVATITIKGYDQFTLYIRSYAESSYDFTEAFALDETAVRGRGLFTTKSKQNQTEYIECKYENIDGLEHTIQIMYSKDGSGDINDDRGYFYIP